ncbi:hypothetical protein, partial [Streptomyces sp. NPDC051546]|uniref:hypothetical protein n=1 Tax=Streptomyces sp. NPDC051546 TaxID=3365655 RepID=UPI0037996E18
MDGDVVVVVAVTVDVGDGDLPAGDSDAGGYAARVVPVVAVGAAVEPRVHGAVGGEVDVVVAGVG